jgi:hypothetical protein
LRADGPAEAPELYGGQSFSAIAPDGTSFHGNLWAATRWPTRPNECAFGGTLSR